MGSNAGSKTANTSVKSRVITQAIAVIVFVVVPILITWMASLTRVDFAKTESGTTATIQRYVLIFIPWQTERVAGVSKVEADITPAKYYRGLRSERRNGRTGVRLSTAIVTIIGDGSEVVVQTAPELAKNIPKQFDEFVASESNEPLTLQIYASWSLSYILGGIATFFCAFYIFGAIVASSIFVIKKFTAVART
jgi:hypothetical protein